MSLDTCFFSGTLASISPDRPETWIADLQRCGNTAATLEEWLSIHDYLVKVLRKFKGDIGVLQRAADDIVRPFRQKPGFGVFARWFQGARERVPALRLVFCDEAGTRAALSRLKLENLDNGILGGEFPESQITVSPDRGHFHLMAAEQVLPQIDELVALTRTQRSLSGKST